LELLQVAGFALGLAVFPAAEEDADPFEGQGADGDGWYAARPDRQQLDWLRKIYPPDATNGSSER